MLSNEYLSTIYELFNEEHKKLLNETLFQIEDMNLQKQINQINMLMAGILKLRNIRARIEIESRK
jgi:hypothetical protein